MKCAKCGSELKEGNVYCSVCGAEAMVVPDYSVLEDDYLRTLITEETSDGGDAEQAQDETTVAAAGEPGKLSWKVPILVVCILLVIGISVGVAAKIIIDDRNANSYDYQVQLAEREYSAGNLTEALRFYQAALALEPKDIAVRLVMADIYLEQRDYDSATALLTQVIAMDSGHREAYKKLIGIYDDRGDYDSILALAAQISATSPLADLFAPYAVTEPVISPIGGTYHEEIDVVIVSLDGYDIYYTIDGDVPDTSTGIPYTGEILLTEPGTYEIHAACANEKGIVSDSVSAIYHLEFLPPAYATVIPDGGRMTDETRVTLIAEPGCSIYYTWDGTDPTIWSTRYEVPIEIPVGNTVLSVLVVNHETGLNSGVYRTNFIYFPDAEV